MLNSRNLPPSAFVIINAESPERTGTLREAWARRKSKQLRRRVEYRDRVFAKASSNAIHPLSPFERDPLLCIVDPRYPATRLNIYRAQTRRGAIDRTARDAEISRSKAWSNNAARSTGHISVAANTRFSNSGLAGESTVHGWLSRSRYICGKYKFRKGGASNPDQFWYARERERERERRRWFDKFSREIMRRESRLGDVEKLATRILLGNSGWMNRSIVWHIIHIE